MIIPIGGLKSMPLKKLFTDFLSFFITFSLWAYIDYLKFGELSPRKLALFAVLYISTTFLISKCILMIKRKKLIKDEIYE